MGALFLSVWGLWTIINAVDALPSVDVRVIIKTNYPGQAPQIVRNGHLSAYHHHAVRAGAKTVRGFHSSRIRMCMSFLKTAPSVLERALACWVSESGSGKLPAGVSSQSVLMPRVWAGF